MYKIKKAIIPAAGLGTRMLPATKAQPKEMLPVLLKPALQYIVEEAVEAGITSICIVTGRNKTSIEDHFDHSIEIEEHMRLKDEPMYEELKRLSDMADIYYIRQKEPKGLGHAVLCAEAFTMGEPFAVMLGDDIIYSPGKPCIGQLAQLAERENASVVASRMVSDEDIGKYGAIRGDRVREDVTLVRELVEKPKKGQAPSNLAILGRYVLDSEIFGYIKNGKPGAGGEIQLTDAISAMARDRKVYALDFAGIRYDTGNKLGYAEAFADYALRDKEIGDRFRQYMKDKLKRENDI